jgi:DNA-binding LytR/AlgR family response regulator
MKTIDIQQLNTKRNPIMVYYDNLNHSKFSNEYLFVKQKDKYQKIKITDINVIHADNNCTMLHFKNNTKILCNKPLAEWVTELDKNYFIRIHRSIVVNMHEIDFIDLTKGMIIIQEMNLRIGRSFREDLNQVFKFII